MSRPESVSSSTAKSGCEHRQLEDLGALLLAAREALVQVAAREVAVDPQQVHVLPEQLAELLDLDRLLALGVDRHAQEVRHRDARDRGGVLEGHEQAGAGALVGIGLGQVLAVQQDAALGDLVVRVAHEGVGERRLARAVRAHQGVGLALLHDEVHAVEDLALLGADVQVLDLQGHAVTVSVCFRVRAGLARSASVISFRVRTMDPCTRVQSSLVGQGSWPSWPSRTQTSVAVGVGADALDRRDVALERAHDLGHGDALGVARERVAAVGAAARLDELGLAQALHEVLEVRERQALGVGDRAERDRACPASLLARCAITRTPYSALVENIIGPLNPTRRVGETRGGLLSSPARAGAGRGLAARGSPPSLGSRRAGSPSRRRA